MIRIGRLRHVLARRPLDRVVQHFPRRPRRREIVPQLQHHRCAEQLVLRVLVVDRRDVAIAVDPDRQPIVLQRRRRDLHRGGGGARATFASNVEHLVADRRQLRKEQHRRLGAGAIENLRQHLTSAGRVDHRNRCRREARELHRRLDRIAARRRDRVEDDERNTSALRVEHLRHGACRRGQHAGELVQRCELVVPGELVRLGDARAGQVVVELMPQDAHPRLAEPLGRIRHAGQPLRRDRGPLGCIGEQFVLAVELLHRRLRRVTAGAVGLQHQLAVVLGKRRELLRRQILRQLVGRSVEHLHRRIRPSSSPSGGSARSLRSAHRRCRRCRHTGTRPTCHRRAA